MTKQSIFEFLTKAEEDLLKENFVEMKYQSNETIIDQGVPLRAIYIINSGEVRIERVEDGNVTSIALIEGGEFIGEVSFADGNPTSARAIAVGETKLSILNGGIIDHLSNLNPRFGVNFYRSIALILSRRLRQTSIKVGKSSFI